MPDEPQILDPTNETAVDAASNADIMEKMMQEAAPSDEVEVVDEKAVSTTFVEPEKAPEEVQATSTPPDEEKPPTEAPPEPTAAPEEHEEDEETKALNKQLDSYQLKDSAKPITKKNFTLVKNITKRVHGEKLEERKGRLAAEARVGELEKLEVLDEPTKQRLTETETRLKQYESERTITADYTPKIQGAEKSAQDTFASAPGVAQGTAKFIADNGGILAFKSSNDFMPTGMKDAQGNVIAMHENGTPFTKREFYNKLIEPYLTPEAAKKITYFDNETTRLDMERQSKIDEARQDLSKWETDRNEKGQIEQKEFGDRFAKRAQDYAKDFGEAAVRKTVPTNATKEEKDSIDKHNQRVDRAEGIAKRYASQITPEMHAEMVLNSAYVETMREIDKEKDTKIKDLEKRATEAETKLDAIKNAGKTSNRVSAPIHPTTKPAEEEEDPEKRMERLLRGEK